MPGDGTLASLRGLLERLDNASVEVEDLSIHTPDLDDVFFAVTGRPNRPAHDRGGTCAMSALAYTVTDSATMLRRNLKHQLRYPSVTVMLVAMPIVFLLLFVYVFGGQLGAGLGAHHAAHGDRTAYLTYVVPGILILTVASAALGTALSVAMDMTEGIIDRFRTMAIARGAVLTGHVLGSLIQTLIGLAIVLGVALAIGYRPPRGRARLAGRSRGAAPVRARAHLAVRRARPGREERRDRQQHPDVPHPAAPALKRIRPDQPRCRTGCASSPNTSLHPRDPDRARPAHRHPHRHPRDRRHRLERGHRSRQLPLGRPTLQPPTGRRSEITAARAVRPVFTRS